MNDFELGATLAVILLVIGLLLAWRRAAGVGQAATERSRLNIHLYHEHLAELEAALASGQLDGGRFQQLKTELDRQLLAETTAAGETTAAAGASGPAWVVVVAILAVPLLSLLLYQQLGASQRVNAMQLLEQVSQLPEGATRSQLLSELVDQLESVDERENDDGFRYALAGFYMELERPADAVVVLEALSERYGGDGLIMGQLFRARYMAGGGELTAELRKLADLALHIEPAQPGLLGVLGMESFQQGEYAAAIDYWQRLKSFLPAGSAQAESVNGGIARAQELMPEGTTQLAGSAANPHAAIETAPAPEAGTVAKTETETDTETGSDVVALSVSVRLGEGLVTNPDDTVFIFAKAVGGPPMPLAVARLRARDLPGEVRLDDSMAMSPAMRLSGFSQVLVVARVSKHGGPEARPGDFEGQSVPLDMAPGAQAVEVIIDTQLAES